MEAIFYRGVGWCGFALQRGKNQFWAQREAHNGSKCVALWGENAFDVKTLDITPEITRRTMKYAEDYALSDSMKLADALIAATAVENYETLCTANEKHYKCTADLQMNVFNVE